MAHKYETTEQWCKSNNPKFMTFEEWAQESPNLKSIIISQPLLSTSILSGPFLSHPTILFMSSLHLGDLLLYFFYYLKYECLVYYSHNPSSVPKPRNVPIHFSHTICPITSLTFIIFLLYLHFYLTRSCTLIPIMNLSTFFWTIPNL